ncbi:MAG: hypothetical protein H6719_22580 [Sandaracinaceae bacterium]|nr:hypothetical protein [Sandaracinaceae bacterium]
MPDEALPPCGVYLTTAPIGSVPAGRLVYFHNHGEPGPGIYLPSQWRGNRARFEARGHLLPTPEHVAHLERLPREGFYRVRETFYCCDQRCRRFDPESLVQLGYDASAQAILFTPQWIDGQLALPERGTRIERDRVASMVALQVPVADTPVHEDGAEEVLLH